MNFISKDNSGKRNMIKAVFALCFVVALLLVLTACNSDQNMVEIEIKAPNAGELTIAPGRHFKVSGALSGKIPDDASLRVTLLDTEGKELRYAVTDQKGIDHIILNVVGGNLTVFNQDTDFSEVAYTAPELAVSDTNNPDASAHDATVKCVYTDTDFYALIVSGTDPEHGLAEADGSFLTTEELVLGRDTDPSDGWKVEKAVGVRRIDEPGSESEPALYEFYNVFPENTLKTGTAYDITIQAYDRNDVEIKGAVCEFTLEN